MRSSIAHATVVARRTFVLVMTGFTSRTALGGCSPMVHPEIGVVVQAVHPLGRIEPTLGEMCTQRSIGLGQMAGVAR